MKKVLLFSLIILSKIIFAQLPTNYCTAGATNIDDEDILNVTFGTINNSTACESLVGSQGIAGGTSAAGKYSDFTNSTVPIPIITPATTFQFSASFGCFTAPNEYQRVYFDWNRDGIFSTNEEYIIGNPGSASTAGTVISIPITVPANVSVGLAKMRVVFKYGSAPSACETFAWGEVEDYVIFLGEKVYDLSPTQVLTPDTISFCGETPTPFVLNVKNTGNQKILNGKVDLFISGINGSTTNIQSTATLSNSLDPDQAGNVLFLPITFPKDEMLKFTFVTYTKDDKNKLNDTLIKYIQVYKKPTFTLTPDSVCQGDTAQVFISNFSKPSFVLWDNQSIDTSTTYKVFTSDSSTQYEFKRVNLTVSRGWKCKVDTFLNIRINPKPTLKLSNDTTLCAGQNTVLSVVTDANTYVWREKDSQAILGSSKNISVGAINKQYSMLVTHSNTGCYRSGLVKVDAVKPTSLKLVNDTACLGDIVQVGLVTSDSNYTFYWKAKDAYTPLIYDTPTTNTTYTIDWYYKKCHGESVVNSKINPLPMVLATAQSQHICLGANTTITATGALNYKWNNGSISSSQIVRPAQITSYFVTGTDKNGCIGTSKVAVYPHKVEIEVYSNKYFNNVCKGDSAILYSRGATTYVWDQGLGKDSIKYVSPSQSTDYTVIGTDPFGCKDTNIFRLSVRPSFKVTTVQDKIGCTGETVKIWASGGAGASYKWGGTLGTDSFANVVLGNSTAYSVTVTSSDSCQLVKTIPVNVLPKPIARSSDASTCSGVEAKIEASGGKIYTWSNGTSGSVLAASPLTTTEYSVTVSNEAGCKDVAVGTIFVVNPDTIKFKTPIDSYICPTIPVTMIATPYGGVWKGSFVSNNLLDLPQVKDTVAFVTYTYLDPIRGCEISKTKIIKVIHDCKSSIHSGILEENQWKAYPNPFEDVINIEVNNGVSEEATINLYDFSGRKIVTQLEKLHQGLNKLKISNLNLAAGTYYIELETEHVNRQMKLIKQ